MNVMNKCKAKLLPNAATEGCLTNSDDQQERLRLGIHLYTVVQKSLPNTRLPPAPYWIWLPIGGPVKAGR